VKVFTDSDSPPSVDLPGALPTVDLPGALPGVDQSVAATQSTDVVSAAASSVDLDQLSVEFLSTLPSSWWPSSLCEYLIHQTYEYAHCPYYQSIIACTLALRFAMLPIAVRTVRNTSRMQHMNPELKAVQARVEKTDMNDPKNQKIYREQMQALFKKYDCNPMRSLALPLVQMPVFMGMFFGLKNLPDKIPEILAVGGPQGLPSILGSDFGNLAIADASFILPAVTAGTFLIMIEVGADGMQTNTDQAKMMKNVMRVLGVASLGFTSWMPQSVFAYWLTNNLFSLSQTVVLKSPALRKACGIWPPPKAAAGEEGKNEIKEAWAKVTQAMKVEEEDQNLDKKVVVKNGPKLLDRKPRKGK